MVEVDEDVPLVRRQRCSGCAFTPGTEANRDPFTKLVREACVTTGRYFYCHRDAADAFNLPEGEALCAGFVQAVTTRIQGGEFDRTTDEERERALRQLEAFGGAVDLMGKATGG